MHLKNTFPFRAFLVAIMCFTLFGLTSCTLDSIGAKQEIASEYWPEMTGGKTYGQTLTMREVGFYRIDLSTATFARLNTAQVVFHLRSAPDSPTDIRTVTLPGELIENDRPTSFVFEPLNDSQDQAYYFFIESPEGLPGNAVTVYANAVDQYAGGTAYRDGQPVQGDLVFTAYSQETFTVSSVVGDFRGRASQDAPFFVVYALLLVGVMVGMRALKNRRSRE